MVGKYYEEVRWMIPILREAAEKEILPRFGKVVEEKKRETKSGYQDTVTLADKKASERILKKVRKNFPGSYSEEHLDDDRFDYDLVWHFDPVDGTREFVEKIKDGFSINAALLKRLESGNYWPVAGIVYLPGVNKLLYNDGSDGVIFLDKGKQVQIPKQGKKEILGWVRRIDPSQKLLDFYKSLGYKVGLQPRSMLRGGIGSSIVDLIEGRINLIVYNYNITREWDWGMAVPIIKAAGGFICDLSGREFTNYNRKETPKNEQYDLNGIVASIVFKKDDIIPNIPRDLLENRL